MAPPVDPLPARRAGRLAVVVGDQAVLFVHLVRLVVLGAVVGVLAGVSAFVFLEGLDLVTETRLDHGWLVWLLPVAGLGIGLVTHHLGGRANRGTALILDEIHAPEAWVPRRMAPLVLVGTWVTHLFGGSAGREGTALQLAGSLTDTAARVLRLRGEDRRLLLVAALSGGFGAVFGVPLAGAVFGLEVPSIGRVRYEALVPALSASLVGDLVVRGLGHAHAVRAPLDLDVTWATAGKVALAGVVFGLVGAVFVEAVDAVRGLAGRLVSWPPLRPALGGAAVAVLSLLVGRDYLGLSLPLIDRALAGDALSFGVFALKLVFTAVTLGCAFPGGEVTPLFVIGATLGAALATPLGLPVEALAAIGFVAVFAGAANTPLACTVMAAELFGASSVALVAVACVVAYVCSSHRGIYPSQRIHASKGPRPVTGRPTLHAWRHRSGGDPQG
jgi:H+/Cl- antiporter ClcA